MFSLFFALLSLSDSLARDRVKCLFLNGETCMFIPTLIDVNPVKLKYYPFIISLNNCTESCISYVISYLQKYVFQKKQKTYMLKHLI